MWNITNTWFWHGILQVECVLASDDFSLFRYEKIGVIHFVSLQCRSRNNAEKKYVWRHEWAQTTEQPKTSKSDKLTEIPVNFTQLRPTSVYSSSAFILHFLDCQWGFYFPPAEYILPKGTQHTAYFGRTKIKLCCRKIKKTYKKFYVSSIAKNKEILRRVVITNQDRFSFSAFPLLACPGLGFEAGGPYPSMQGPRSLTWSSGSWSINSCLLDHSSLPMEDQGL